MLRYVQFVSVSGCAFCRHLLSHNQYEVHSAAFWRQVALWYSYNFQLWFFCFFFLKYFWLLPDEIVCRLDTFARHIPKKNLHAKSERDNCMIQNPTKPKLTLLTTQSTPPSSLSLFIFSLRSLLGATPSLCAACEYRLSCRLVSSRVASHHIASLFDFFFVFYSIIVICNCVCVCVCWCACDG